MKKEPKSKIIKWPLQRDTSKLTMYEYMRWLYKELKIEPPSKSLIKELAENEK